MSNLFNKVIQGMKFNFQPLEFGNETGYHIDVMDKEGTRWEFRMLASDPEDVKLQGENLPEWIYDLEPELYAAVRQHD